MVFGKIKSIFEKSREKRINESIEKNKLNSYRENEQMLKAEQIKKEADRLGYLRQYKSAIEEYENALDAFPFDEKEIEFKGPAEFFFKTYYNMAAAYSYINKFDKSIDYFDKALFISNIEPDNKAKALLSKGNCYYRAKCLLKDGAAENYYSVRLDSEYEIDEKTSDIFKKLDNKENLLNLAHKCFTSTTEIDRNNADAWYKKGHMEFLLGKVKEAMLSFDNVLGIDKQFQNKEAIKLFDDIKIEKGIEIKNMSIYHEARFKTKTGHLVRNKAEKMIANFLFENGLVFQYNPMVSWADKDDFKAGFYIPKLDLYIEHFKSNPRNSIDWTIKQYEKNKKKLVYTTVDDERNIEESLKIKIKPYIFL
jgi:tetratricopeptide (TPR) repeat protein